MHTSCVAWEQSWEEDFNAVYSPDNIKHFPHLVLRVQSGTSDDTLDTVALSLYNNVHAICKAQRRLARDVAERFARDDFENKWRSISHENRCAYILGGIYKTMCRPDLVKTRKYCPDSTLSYLASREGSTYIEMLKTVLPADLNVPVTEPIQFPHPIMDRVLYLSPEDEHKFEAAAMNCEERQWRTYCMTSIIWDIFNGFVSSS